MKKTVFTMLIVSTAFILGLVTVPPTLKAEISPIGAYDKCEGACGCQPKIQSPVVSETSVTNECGQVSGASINGNTVTAFAWDESATLSEDGTTLAWQDGSNWVRTLSIPTLIPTDIPMPTVTPTNTPTLTSTPTPSDQTSCEDMAPNECAKCCAGEHRQRQVKCRGNASCTLDSVRRLHACNAACTFQ